MFRVIFLTFYGSYRGQGHPHESPRVMIWPMVVLSALAVFSGLSNVTGGFGHFLGHGETRGFIEGFLGVFSHPLTWLSLLTAGGGILLAYAMYQAKWLSPERIRNFFSLLHKLFSRKYWIDELYENIIARVLLLKGLFRGFSVFDSRFLDGGLNTILVENFIVRRFFSSLKTMDDKGVDGAVNGVASTTIATGRTVRKAQTGQLQLYGAFIVMGILTILLFVYFTN